METKQLIELNEQANKEIEAGVESLKNNFSGGVDIMGLVMNPTKAADKFGGGVMQILEGLEKLRQVNSELVLRVATDER